MPPKGICNSDPIFCDRFVIQIQFFCDRYIRGFLTRRKIRPLLAERVEKIVANNNPVEINEVRDELQVNIMTSEMSRGGLEVELWLRIQLKVNVTTSVD